MIPGRCPGTAAGTGADFIEAVDYALASTPARIFNYSAGSPTSSDDASLSPIVDLYSDAHDVLFVVAAGNSGPGPVTVNSPGTAYNALTVANLDDRNTPERADDQIAPSSSRGPTVLGRAKPDLAAPGTNINSAAHDTDGFRNLSGTSMAAPHVAGAAALLAQAGLKSPLAVRALLINSADGSGWRADTGWGVLNLARAQSEADKVVGDVIPAQAIRFYAGTVQAGLKATVTWNRHVSVSGQIVRFGLADLDLELYSRPDGSLLSRSNSTVNNVEQVQTAAAGSLLLKVKRKADAVQAAGMGQEPYTLALSAAGFRRLEPPRLEISCTTPGSVAATSTFTLNCQVSNRGGIEAGAVSAVLNVPSGFRQPGALSLGQIPEGVQRTVSFLVTAPALSGNFTFSARVESNTFGESFSAVSSPMGVAIVDREQITLTASPARVDLSATAGGAAPLPVPVEIRAANANFLYSVSASSDGNWLSVTPAGGSLPATIRIAAATGGLSPGTYSGAVLVSVAGAANSPLAIPITLRVAAAQSVRLLNRMTARAVPETCAAPQAVTSFLPTDERVFAWFLVSGASQGDRASIEWIAPSGVTFQTGAWRPLASPGNWCFSASLSIAGTPVAAMTGAWKARITYNGDELFTLGFEIGTPIIVRKHVLAKEASRGHACEEPQPGGDFLTTDEQALLWLALDGAKGGERVRYEFVSPRQEVALSGRFNPISGPGSWCFLSSALRIAGTDNAAQPGVWKANVYVDEALILSAEFQLIQGFAVESKLLTKVLPEAGCSEPPAAGAFFKGDARAVLWFSVVNPSAGDQAAAEWMSANGEVYARIPWDPIPEPGGRRCFWSSIDIADNPPAALFGEWKVRVTWNGRELFVLPFHILSVEVINRMTTRSIPEGAECPAPEPATAFTPQDEAVWLWFLVRGASAGDRARRVWHRPGGALFDEGAWEPLPRAGSFCFAASIHVAGGPAAELTGDWGVQVFWNDILLFEQPFSIQVPATGAAKPLRSQSAAAAFSATAGHRNERDGVKN